MIDKSEGKIAFVSPKGFGFIAVEGEEKNIFFHAKDLIYGTWDEVELNKPVTFNDVIKGDKGWIAHNVRIIKK